MSYLVRGLYDVKGWAYYWRCKALEKYCPKDFKFTMGVDYGAQLKREPHDILLQLAYSYAKPARNHIDKLTKRRRRPLLVCSYNVGWGYADKWLTDTMRHADFTIINNREMWEKAGKLPKTINISNGVDGDTFRPIVPIKKRPVKVLWVGSEGHRVVKGYDDYVLPMIDKLKANGIEVDARLTNSHKAPMTHSEMADWYNTGSIYLVTSKTEGTPNPALEAASCGCVIVSTKVGNMPELIKNGINGYLCERNMDDLYNAILKAADNRVKLGDRMLNDIEDWHWVNRSKVYYDLFRKLLNKQIKTGVTV